MKAIVSTLVLLFAFCMAEAQTASNQLLPEDPLAGANVFVQKNCVQCHSIKSGDISNRLGPNLGNIHLRGSFLDIAAIMWNHAPAMMQKMGELKIETPTFTGKEMANLIAFLTAYQYYLKEVGHPGDPAKGEVVWREKKCSACHAFEENWGKVAPSLRIYKSSSPIDMAQAMWNHGPEMANTMSVKGIPIPKFYDNEMLDLISYIRVQTPSQEEVYVEPGNPNRGSTLFRQKNCFSCHRISGKDGTGGPDLGKQKELLKDVSHVAGLMWNHSVGMWNEMKRRNIPIPTFQHSEMADLIAYLYLINYYDPPGDPAEGKTLFEQRYCSSCHRLSGVAAIGPNLAEIQNLDSSIEVVAAMWNHIPQMRKKTQEVGLLWPRINPGEMRNIVAYLFQERSAMSMQK